MNIAKMLTISTAHIKKETAEFIDSVCKDNGLSNLIVYDKTVRFNDYMEVYGWFIYCNVALPDLNVPEDLLKAMCFTSDNNCDWLCIDRDGDVVDDLDEYEW